jgi:GNAT superfamily N-acetyltransferase
MRSPEDIRAWATLPYAGTAETAAAPFWRTLHKLAPDARVVVVRRPRAEVLASLLRLPIAFDADVLAKELARLDRKLDQIAARWPGAISVDYADLATEATCARVFQHCLPFPHDPEWWARWAPLNLQCDMPALMRYAIAYAPQLGKLAAQLKQQTIAGVGSPRDIDGVTFQQEPFDTFYRDARACFEEHLVQTGQAPDDHTRKNLPLLRALDAIGALEITTARSRNGLMHGYLMSIVSPSLDAPDIIEGTHTIFFASPDIRGLGLKLQRAAIAALRRRGVNEVVMRAGVRGSGPRLGSLYRRLGAEPMGEIYRLKLEA